MIKYVIRKLYVISIYIYQLYINYTWKSMNDVIRTNSSTELWNSSDLYCLIHHDPPSQVLRKMPKGTLGLQTVPGNSQPSKATTLSRIRCLVVIVDAFKKSLSAAENKALTLQHVHGLQMNHGIMRHDLSIIHSIRMNQHRLSPAMPRYIKICRTKHMYRL